MSCDQLPLEYLVTSSQTALEGFELSRLNQCANLRKELRQITDQWIEVEIEARMARWILECRRAQDSHSNSSSPESTTPATSGALTCGEGADVTPAKSSKAQAVLPRTSEGQRRLRFTSTEKETAPPPLIPVITLDSENPSRVVPARESLTQATAILPHGEAALRLLEQFVQFQSTSFGARLADPPANSRKRSPQSVVTIPPPCKMRPAGPATAPLHLSITRCCAASAF
jgi:hypothetical protein